MVSCVSCHSAKKGGGVFHPPKFCSIWNGTVYLPPENGTPTAYQKLVPDAAFCFLDSFFVPFFCGIFCAFFLAHTLTPSLTPSLTPTLTPTLTPSLPHSLTATATPLQARSGRPRISTFVWGRGKASRTSLQGGGGHSRPRQGGGVWKRGSSVYPPFFLHVQAF